MSGPHCPDPHCTSELCSMLPELEEVLTRAVKAAVRDQIETAPSRAIFDAMQATLPESGHFGHLCLASLMQLRAIVQAGMDTGREIREAEAALRH